MTMGYIQANGCRVATCLSMAAGSATWGRAVMRDREILARDGFMIVAVTVDRETGELIDDPDILSRGFIYLREADELIDMVKRTVEQSLEDSRKEPQRQTARHAPGQRQQGAVQRDQTPSDGLQYHQRTLS